MGGTNPQVIRALIQRGANVRQLDHLHAKVYIGATTAVVTSANASANGLALQGLEQAHWSEAGVEIGIGDAADAVAWFKKVWFEGQPIKEEDLRRADALWKRRRRLKPTLSFADYDIEVEAAEGTLPFTCWWGSKVVWKADPERAQETLGHYHEGMFAFEMEDEQDAEVITPGTWLLWWRRGASGAPLKDKLTLSKAGRYVPGVMRHLHGEQENVGAILAVDDPGPVPFDTSEERFFKAFKEVICRPQFAAYRAAEGPPWFTILEPELANFWRQVQQRYLELPAA
jgi:hypothetical protein